MTDRAISISVNVHPEPDHVHTMTCGEDGKDVWLDFKGTAYSSVSVRMTPEVAQAIVDAMAPHFTLMLGEKA